MHASFARGVDQEVIVAPVAQSECTLRNPGQQREHDADLEAKDNVENDTELR